MKKKLNKKLLNLIALCSGITATVGLGVGGVIYSLRQEKDGGDEPIDQNILPENVYDINENNVLLGFKDAFLNNPDSEIYKDNFQNCDTMKIPARVTSIADNAFTDDPEAIYPNSTIPSYIKKLTFGKSSKIISIEERAFYGSSSLVSVDLLNCTSLTTILRYGFKECSSLTSITFPSSLTEFGEYIFWNCSKLNYFAWDLPNKYETKINFSPYTFWIISPTGTVKSLNPSITSQQLFDWIKGKGNFPEAGWGPAD